MKVLAVLVLAVFTGCNANLFYADAPKSQLDMLIDAARDYVGQATKTTNDALEMISSSQLGEDVREHLIDSYMLAYKHGKNIYGQLPPAAQDLIVKVDTETSALFELMVQGLNNVQDQLKPYTDEMTIQVEERAKQLKQVLEPFAENLDVEGLRSGLNLKTDELKASLGETVKNMQIQLQPYTDNLRVTLDHHIQDFKMNLGPMTETMQTELTERTKQVQELAAPYVENLKERLDPYTQNLQAHLTSLYDSVIKSS